MVSYCSFTHFHIFIFFQEALPDFESVHYYEAAKGLNLQRPHDIHWEALQRAEELVNRTFNTVIGIGKQLKTKVQEAVFVQNRR